MTLALQNRYQFPKDSSLQNSRPAACWAISTSASSPGADEALSGRGRHRVTATQSAVVLENLIGQFLYGKAEEGAGSGAAANKK